MDSDTWLSGFIGAVGHFTVRATATSKVECKFELTQRQKDYNGSSNLDFPNILSKFLLCKVRDIKLDKPKSEYRIRISNLNGNLILLSYLNKYPLLSSKYLDYKDWNKVLDYLNKINISTKIIFKILL